SLGQQTVDDGGEPGPGDVVAAAPQLEAERHRGVDVAHEGRDHEEDPAHEGPATFAGSAGRAGSPTPTAVCAASHGTRCASTSSGASISSACEHPSTMRSSVSGRQA